MNTPLEELLKTMHRDTLASEERERMRTLLSEYAAFKPVRAAPTLLPAHPSNIFARPIFASAMVFAMLIATTGGAAFAAEGALPGDTLYPLKVDVTEPVVTAFTPAGRAQAAWQITIATRRLGEAETLSREGRLATSTRAFLIQQAADATLKGAVSAGASASSTGEMTSSTEDFDAASHLFEEGRMRLEGNDNQGASSAFRASIHAAIRLPAFANVSSTSLKFLDDTNATSSPEDVPGEEPSATSSDDGASLQSAAIQGFLHAQVTASSTKAWRAREQERE